MFAIAAVVAVAVHAQTAKRWDFNLNTVAGVAPPEWIRESGSFTYNFRALDGSLLLWNTPNLALDRTKIRTAREDFRTGTYTFRIFVETPPEGDTSMSIGAFLLSPQSKGDNKMREIDFEIGYGKPEARKRAGVPVSDRTWAVVYMTVHRDDTSGQRNSYAVKAIRTNQWYIAQLVLEKAPASVATKIVPYRVRWRIYPDGTLPPKVDDFQVLTNYGPSNTSFFIAGSLETLPDYMGTRAARTSRHVKFDFISYQP
jgi:hypothetical protein